MEIAQLKEQLQDELLTYLESVVACEYHGTYLDSDILDTVCDIVIETLDKARQN